MLLLVGLMRRRGGGEGVDRWWCLKESVVELVCGGNGSVVNGLKDFLALEV